MIKNKKKILAALTIFLKALMILICGYLLIIIVIVLWTFEVKLQRWPIFIYSAPFSLRIGDDINGVRLLERLGRLGHVGNDVVVQEPGQWTLSGSELSIFLKYSPLKGLGIVSGPVGISLDWNKIRSIHLVRAMEDVNQITFEPELINIIPARGCGPELCRPVSLENVPPLLKDAIILTEDTHFFSHSGIDLTSIHRAFKTNIKAGRYVQGGSTISQQLIRMTLLTPEKTLWRKVNEILLAVGAEAIYSKKTILQAYLNRVYLGHWGAFPIRGIAEASRHFFGKDLPELDPAECALLAATIRAPNVINPYRHPERAHSRRNMVLGLLFKAGEISRDAYEEASESTVKMRKPGWTPVRADAFVDLVKVHLHAERTSAGPSRQDVVTSLDPLIQTDADLELKKLGDAAVQSYLILLAPQSGEIKAFIVPNPQKWTGSGGNLETVLPFVIIPALVSEKHDQVRYTLTSDLFTGSQEGIPLTFRQAFQKERLLLLEKLCASLGTDKIVSVLKEFGINARLKDHREIIIGPITPMQMAQIYSMLATLGNAPSLGAGVKVLDGISKGKTLERKRVSVEPPILFLVNYLLKGLQPADEKDIGPDNTWSKLSTFKARDLEGSWNIAYRSDSLLLVRTPGHDIKEAKIMNMVSNLLPQAKAGSENNAQIPEGVFFRKICVQSGLLATSTCPQVIREPFLKGTQPLQWCPYRHEANPVLSDTRN